MAAATLISWANSFGDRRRAAKASSGTSIVTVAILLLLFLGNLAQSSRHQMDQGQASFTDYTCFRPAQTVRCSCPVSGVRYGVPGTMWKGPPNADDEFGWLVLGVVVW